MFHLKIWLQAARLRTLPLAASGVMCGAAMAWYQSFFSLKISLLSLLTALLLQVLSNFANDYGDAQKGTDNDQRIGPQRAIQSGALSPSQMKQAILVTSVLILFSGSVLIAVSVKIIQEAWLFFLLLGILSLGAAVFYTVGRRPYGYRGWGDVMVFLFFGLISVGGTFYLNAGYISPEAISLAVAIGMLSAGVINLNNMRDIENDAASGKATLAVRLGFKKAKIYHSLLLCMALACFFYSIIKIHIINHLIILLIFPPLLIGFDVLKMHRISDKALLDSLLKRLVINTFLLSLFFVVFLIFNALLS